METVVWIHSDDRDMSVVDRVDWLSTLVDYMGSFNWNRKRV